MPGVQSDDGSTSTTADASAPVDVLVAPDAPSPGTDGSLVSPPGCSGVFCEDFEKGAIDPAVWNISVDGIQTAGTVQTAVVAHGKYAVQFHFKAAGQGGQPHNFILTKNAPSSLQGHHFGRAYFNVTPKPPVAHTEFLFAGSPGFPKLKYLEVASNGSGFQLTYVNLISGGESYHSGGALPDARWVCLEWEFGDVPDVATVFVDGVANLSRGPTSYPFTPAPGSGLVGKFSDFGFGYWAWHPSAYDFDIYYDDIVLNTVRVGCLAH